MRIVVLGDFEVVRAGHTLTRADWGRLSAERLVKLLAVTPAHRLSRERAAELLWPEAPPSASSANLRKALHFARRALGDAGAWSVDAGFVGLDPVRIDVDLDRLSSAIDALDRPRRHARGAIATILELGGRDLLPDDTDEDWLIAPRERLVGRWLQVAIGAAEAARDEGRTAEAHEIVERILDRDPTDEAAHRLAIRLYAAEGRHHAARRQYEACRRALRELVDAEPSPETEAVYRAAERSATVARASSPPAPRLVGRHIELEQVERVLDAVASGRSAAIVVHGPAGIGKSRLLREVAACGRAAGWRVLEWEATDAMRAASYAPFRLALGRDLPTGDLDAWPEPARSAVLTIVPGSGAPAVAFADRASLEVALVGAIGVLARSCPLLLVVDDLPFLDPASTGLLAAVLGGLPDAPVLIASAYRDDEPVGLDARTFLEPAMRHGGLEIEVGPLGPRDVERLIADHLGAETIEPSLARRIHEQGGGNPLFCLEIAREGRERGAIRVEHGRWAQARGTGGYPVPVSARRLVEDRLGRLSESTRALLVVAAALPATIPYALLSTVLEDEGAALVPDLDAALASGLLVERDGGYAFDHPLYRRATLDSAGPATRASVELGIATALAGVPPTASAHTLEGAARDCRDAPVVAEHALLALESGRSEARPLAVAFAFGAAAEQRRLFERAGAVELLERGIRAWRDLRADARAGFDGSGALVMLAELQRVAGDDAAASATFREAIATARDADELARAYDAFQWVPYDHGDFEVTRALLDEGLARLPDEARAERARLRRDVGWCLVRQGRVEEGVPALEAAADVLEASEGASPETMRALDLLGDALGLAGRTEEAIIRLRRSLAIAQELGDPGGELGARAHLAATLGRAGRPAEARPHLEHALELARLGGDRYLESVVAMIGAEIEDGLGHPDRAAELLERELALLEAIGGNPRHEAVAHSLLALLARRRGDATESEREAGLARRAAERLGDADFVARTEANLSIATWTDAQY